MAHLQLDLGLGNILLAATTIGYLLGLGDLSLNSIGAEVLQGESLDGVDAHDRVGLDNGETSRYCVMLLVKLWPGFSKT